jgi:hypothetical protein
MAEARGACEASPPGADEDAGGGEHPRDGAPVPPLPQVDVPVADPPRGSAAARRRHAHASATTGVRQPRFPASRWRKESGVTAMGTESTDPRRFAGDGMGLGDLG